MAATVDTGNSPIRFAGAPSSPTGAITSASFTAPADSVIVVCVEMDGNGGEGRTYSVTDSGALSWGERVRRDWSESTSGGASGIWTAVQATSAARTVSVTNTAGAAVQFSAKVYVVTGGDVNGTPVDTVGANNEGGSSTDNLTTSSLTPEATGLLFAADCDWEANGVFDASSDLTQNTTHYAGVVSVCDGYKVCTSGVGVTANLNAGPTGPWQHKWCQIIVREYSEPPEPGALIFNRSIG